MKLLITRPIKQAQEFSQQVENLGNEAIIYPLLEITNLNIDLEVIKKFDGIIITSRNALDSIFNLNKEIKLYIVGKQTAEYANILDFKNVQFAGETITELKKIINQKDNLLYCSGDNVTDDLKGYKNIKRIIVYNSNPIKEISNNIIDFFYEKETKVISLFSLKTAENLLYLLNKYNLLLYCDKIILLALSSKIAAVFNDIKFKKILVAGRPDQQAMLSLIERVNLDERE
ncbi:MAG: uroporphyrinogen-III synthase [Pseudomonadota bacterium]